MREPIIIPTEHVTQEIILAKLVELIRLCAARGIHVEGLMRRAISQCDAEPPYSN